MMMLKKSEQPEVSEMKTIIIFLMCYPKKYRVKMNIENLLIYF